MLRLKGCLLASLLVAGMANAAQSGNYASDLAKQSNNPGAPLMQLTVQNTYSPENYAGDGGANELQFQPVIPLPAFGILPWPSIARPSVPLATSAGPAHETSLGDIELLYILVPHLQAAFSWGFGAEFTFPTAGADSNGEGKWIGGPAAYLLATRGNLQFGAIARQRNSFAGESSREDISEMAVQPILQYNLNNGWYVSMGDFDWTFDWRDGGTTIPAAFQVGRITSLGAHLYNLSVEGGYYLAHDGPGPRYSIRLGVSRLLPER